jgi:hypothetical protein
VTDPGIRPRLVLRSPDGRFTPIEVSTATEPEVDFVAFAASGRISGRLRLEGDHLLDWLRDHDGVELADVRALELSTGRSVAVRTIRLGRDELFLIKAIGRRSEFIRRAETIPRTLTAKVGRYLVTGELHTEPGFDPLLQIKRRGRDLIPLTDAVVSYAGPRGTVEESVALLLVNRSHLGWARRTGVLA